MRSDDFYIGLKSQTMVRPSPYSMLGGLKNQRKKEHSYYSSMISKMPNMIYKELSNFDNLNFVLYEGQVVTVAGLVTYNANLNEFEMSSPIAVICGESKNLIKKSLEYANKNFTTFTILSVTCITLT